jgi:hypothetical protein
VGDGAGPSAALLDGAAEERADAVLLVHDQIGRHGRAPEART